MNGGDLFRFGFCFVIFWDGSITVFFCREISWQSRDVAPPHSRRLEGCGRRGAPGRGVAADIADQLLKVRFGPELVDGRAS